MNDQVHWVSSSSSYQPYPAAAANQHHVNQQYGASSSNQQAFDDEPPLLEGKAFYEFDRPSWASDDHLTELGIDLAGILKKTRSILLHRLNNRLLEDLDFGGALVFILVLAGLHLLVRD
jgi:hypothetical protein